MSYGTQACVRMPHVQLMHTSGSQIVEFVHCALRFWEACDACSPADEELDWSFERLDLQPAFLARAFQHDVPQGLAEPPMLLRPIQQRVKKSDYYQSNHACASAALRSDGKAVLHEKFLLIST